MNYSKTASKIREKLKEFSGNLSKGLSRPASRFVGEMVYGMTTRQSVLLSEVVRSLEEEIPEIKTENRLSARLKHAGLGRHIRMSVMREGCELVGKDTLIILDLSDIAKKHAKSMEYLARVRDGSALVGNRNTRPALELAGTCPMSFSETVMRGRDGKPTPTRVEFGARRVKLPWRDEEPWLVVVKGFGEEPMMLLTNVELAKSRKALWRMVESYVTRREIEETIRYVKQSYGLENARVRGYEALRNMFSLLPAVVCFATTRPGTFARLGIMAHHAVTAAKRFFGRPGFVYYAIADGLGELLRRHGKYRKNQKPQGETSPQLVLL